MKCVRWFVSLPQVSDESVAVVTHEFYEYMVGVLKDEIARVREAANA